MVYCKGWVAENQVIGNWLRRAYGSWHQKTVKCDRENL